MFTEDRAARYLHVEGWSTTELVDAILEGQLAAIAAALGAAQAIAAAVEQAAARLEHGGRLIYAGAGTSGRIAVQDGVELGPTYGWRHDRLAFLIAGGADALQTSSEAAEDDAVAGKAALDALAAGPNDVVIGVAASGRTPYTCAIVETARTTGALTIGVASNSPSPLLEQSEIPIYVPTGAEIVSGSTRMKAGTAQKAILNTLSTAIMVKLGRVYMGQMTHMSVSNNKLRERAIAMIAQISGAGEEMSARALDTCSLDIPTAILVACGEDPGAARAKLERTGGNLARALRENDRA
ncbi:N-acetylmuramic acid 6-phosphate etherase [Croceicoccus marinus]|jgi:N-acetylmuramic acid 6-phosphate etherase|uniref:N-acetylmuramic acid 6-phosphate etherase n=1 Tax=Croceicoccus marinus TaxID=450378 RepID=A0A7G6VZI9_9SPHN|nr:N-acetylmuramic acid 6-phosphate etherase [Croceicoccus marinus]QNE07154.1 N-acetylmuramic acid 6-phosphate etherase [Croceicoccus marinus]